jgi:S-formylglutathione hydrolase FrmB
VKRYPFASDSRFARLLLAFALLPFLAAPAGAEVRQSSFHSPSLQAEVSYVVDLPPSYEGSERRYPVVYALHGLFEGPGFWERRGLARELSRLRADGVVPDFIVVAVDGGNSFFMNGPLGRYEDLVTKDLIAHVESTYRVIPGRGGRVLLGVSMGGYGALRIAFAHPELFAAVATHSAMLLERIPSAAQGAGRWHMRAFHEAFGNPIDEALWNANDPLNWARRVDPARVPALYFDCGAKDRYGLARGHQMLDRILTDRGVAHRMELPPGDHGYEFVRGRLDESLGFLAAALDNSGNAVSTDVPGVFRSVFEKHRKPQSARNRPRRASHLPKRCKIEDRCRLASSREGTQDSTPPLETGVECRVPLSP